MGVINYSGVSKFKSLNRAIKRGLMSPEGFIYPNRPFNNRKSIKGSRSINELKKQIYGNIKFREA